MLRLRGASAISNSLCNRHRNNDHCLATGQVAARCRKGTRVMRAAPARLPRRTAHARAGGGAGRGLGRGRRRERGGGGAGRGEGPPACKSLAFAGIFSTEDSVHSIHQGPAQIYLNLLLESGSASFPDNTSSYR